MEIVTSEENIKLAYRNIKKNKGSKTAGVDNKTIENLSKMNVEKLIETVRNKLIWYQPQAVLRVEIPKQNDPTKKRPLGIPTIMDRLNKSGIRNVMNCNTSMVILDPKGEIARDTGELLKSRGMEVKVLDLINMCKSHCYNPFVYLKEDNDVQRLVTNLFKSTTPKGSQSQDPFWDTAASMLLLALVFYLKYEAPPDEQNFPMVMEMLRSADVREDDEGYQSPLDELFDRLEMRNPEHIALKYYHNYRSGSAKTLKSIQITLAARLEKFNLESLAALSITDELDLESLGEKKTALFIIIPDNDSSFNFLVSILYTQLFQQLFYSADHKHGGALPVHVHMIMDEFANATQFLR